MNLNSSLFEASSVGNTGGILTMNFTSMNSSDINSSGFWIGAQQGGISQNYSLGSTTSVQVQVALGGGNQQQYQLYLNSPYIAVSLPGGGGYGTVLTWSAVGCFFQPGSPALTTQTCRYQGTVAQVTYNFGIDFVWDWDGVFGNGYGRWWANWQQQNTKKRPKAKK